MGWLLDVAFEADTLALSALRRNKDAERIHMTDSQEEGIERILEDARQYYRDKGLISDAEWDVYRKV